MEKYRKILKKYVLQVLVLILCLFFSTQSLAESGDKFDISKSKEVDLNKITKGVENGTMFSTYDAFMKLHPDCKNFESCKKKYNLIGAKVYISDKNVYFYAFKTLDYYKKGKPPRLKILTIKAEKERVQKFVEEENVDQ